jgi:putative hemolysin
MPSPDGTMAGLVGILAVLVLVAANGFFVAAEFSLVAVRKSRVAELVAAGRKNAAPLQRATENLDAHLAATQLGITMSSLALGWIGEPALAHLIEPGLSFLPGMAATASAHAAAVAIAFTIITALHIVLGELAPKSLALQRPEGTALWIVRPLSVFLFLLKPAIAALNGLGNLTLQLFGLHPGTGEQSLHSPQELKQLIVASGEAGLLQGTQQEVVERVFNIGDRRIGDIMTPRPQVEWIDLDGHREEMIRTIRTCRHEQLLAGKGSRAEPLGVIRKSDLIDQLLDGGAFNPAAVIREPLVVHESARVFQVLEQFKRAPVRMAAVVDEYGVLQGIVTQTDLLEALAGDLPDITGEEPEVIEREDGSLLLDGMMSAQDAFDRLGVRVRPANGSFHTIAGFALFRLGRLPVAGERFDHDGWRFEIVDIDGRRIDKLLASRIPVAPDRP